MKHLPAILLAIFIVLVGIVGWRTLLAPVTLEQTSIASALSAELGVTNFLTAALSLATASGSEADLQNSLTVDAQQVVMTEEVTLALDQFMQLNVSQTEAAKIEELYFTGDDSALALVRFSGNEEAVRSIELVKTEAGWRVNAVFLVDLVS